MNEEGPVDAMSIEPPPSAPAATVESKRLRAVLADAAARVEAHSGRPSPAVLRWVEDDSDLARLLAGAGPADDDDEVVEVFEDLPGTSGVERGDPPGPEVDEPSSLDGGPSEATGFDLSSMMVDLRIWLSRSGRSADEVVARLGGDIARLVTRHQAAVPNDHEARIDLVLVVVQRVRSDPRVAEVIRTLTQLATTEIDGWGMVETATQAALLIDRDEVPAVHLLCNHRILSAAVRLLREGRAPFDLDVIAHPARSVGFELGRLDPADVVGSAAGERLGAAARTAALTVRNGVPEHLEDALWSALAVSMPPSSLSLVSELTYASLTPFATQPSATSAALLLLDAVASATGSSPSRTASILVATGASLERDALYPLFVAAGVWTRLVAEPEATPALGSTEVAEHLSRLVRLLGPVDPEHEPPGRRRLLGAIRHLAETGVLAPVPTLTEVDWDAYGPPSDGADAVVDLLHGLRAALGSWGVDPVTDQRATRRRRWRSEDTPEPEPDLALGMWADWPEPMVDWLAAVIRRLEEQGDIDLPDALAVVREIAVLRRLADRAVPAVIETWDELPLTGEAADLAGAFVDRGAAVEEAERWLEGAQPDLGRALREIR